MKSNNQLKYFVLFFCFAVLFTAKTAFSEDIFVVHPTSTQSQSQSVSIPLTLNNYLSTDILSIELEIGYDPNVLTATGISLTDTVLNNQDYLNVFNTNIPGTIYAIFASSTDIFTTTGMLLYLDFIVNGTTGESSDISIVSARFNNYEASSSDGIFTVVASNTPPVISSISDQTTDEDAAKTVPFTVTDYETPSCDLGITITSSNQSLFVNSNITYNCQAETYNITLTPEMDQSGMSTITVIVADSDGLTVSTQFDLSVTAVNDSPVLANPISNRIATEGTEYVFTFNENVFTDVDTSDTLTYTATQLNGNALPSWLTFDGASRTFSGLPSNSDVGAITITITATDGSAQSITDTFVLSVNNTNTAPVLDNPIDDQTILEDAAYSFIFGENTFRDEDVIFGDSLSYSAVLSDGNPLPSWLTFDENNRHFSGTPTNDDVGTYAINVIAEDTLNLTAMDSFYLTVANVNDAPEISEIVRNSTTISMTGLTIDEDTNVDDISFSIADVDDTNLTVSLTSSNTSLLPLSNMDYTCINDSCTMALIPVANENGTATVTITITDSHGLEASNTFDLNVTSINDIPTLSDISSQSMNEGDAIQVSFIADDIESNTLSVSAISADQSLILDSRLTLANNGDLYTLTISPNAFQAGQTDITISANDGIDSTETTFSITVNEIHYVISGHVSSYTDIGSSHLQNVIMTLSGTYSYSTITDESGNYAFATVRPGSYTLTASKTDAISLDLADAIKILKGAVKLINLTCHEQIAADAYIDGYYGAFDAAKVAHYVGGLEDCLNNNCVFWQFIPEEISSCENWPLIEIENSRRYTDLNGDKFDQDFIGIGCGNVSQ